MLLDSAPTPAIGARRTYNAVLAAFAQQLKVARLRRGMTVAELSRISGIEAPRLVGYEVAAVPVHFADALLLASAARVRLSQFIATLQRPSASLSAADCKALVKFANDQQHKLQRRGIGWDNIRGAATLDDGFDDATLADWPAYLPPFLHECLWVEDATLEVVFRVLTAKRDEQGRPVRIHPNRADLTSGVLIDRIQATSTHLEWLALRHANSAAPIFRGQIKLQRLRLAKASTLLASYHRFSHHDAVSNDATLDQLAAEVDVQDDVREAAACIAAVTEALRALAHNARPASELAHSSPYVH